MNSNYTALNLLAFCLTGFSCIAIVVFLTSSQPFYLNEVIGVDNERIGNAIGTLGLTDEVASMVTAPLVGALNDKINRIQFFVGGSKVIEVCGFWVLALALVGYGKFASNLIPDLLFFRAIFAVGVTSVMSMVTVLLSELTFSDFTLGKFLWWRREIDQETIPLVRSKNGKLSALIGISTGCGAIFAVSFFLTLPVNISDRYPDFTMKESLQASYKLIACFAIFVSFVLGAFLYNSTGTQGSVEKESYFQLLATGFNLFRKNKKVQHAYMGGFVARATTVSTSVFIPLLVYNYYQKSGLCSPSDMEVDQPSRQNCHDGYIFAAILNGVAQTVALISAPFWAILVDSRIGHVKSLIISAILGSTACFGLCLFELSQDVYNPKSVSCFILISLLGASQIGSIVTTMSMLSSIDTNNNMGSLSGLYNLSGAVGILIISKVGGAWSDHWIVGPFFLLGLFNIVLLTSCLVNNENENISPHITDEEQ